jgi:cytochrome P450
VDPRSRREDAAVTIENPATTEPRAWPETSWVDPTPRPPRCYEPRTAPHRDEQGVHVYDYATIRGLLRDPNRVTSDVTEMLTPEQRDHLHPVSSFVWATDRRTISGCPGRHAGLRAVMAPWFSPQAVATREQSARAACEPVAQQIDRRTDRPFDVFGDYTLPVVVAYLADWLGVEPADVTYAIEDQLAVGDIFATWPPLASAEMDDRYRTLMDRPGLGGVAGAARDLVGSGVITEREAWGILYSIAVSAVATATTITLTTGLSVEHDLWSRMTDPDDARRAIEEAIRFGTPFPQASRFARESFVLGDVQVHPEDQVLMWLTAANRDLPGPHQQPLHRFDPWRDSTRHLGWGSGYHLCGGVHHARAIALTAVTTLARRCPELGFAGPWKRFVGIDDGFEMAPATARPSPE